MKTLTLNLGTIIVSFAIGLAINSACAGSLENNSNNDANNIQDDEIKELVISLRDELKSLKDDLNEANTVITILNKDIKLLKDENIALSNRVKTLEDISTTSPDSGSNLSSCGMFQVDGLWYLPSGYVCGKPISTTCSSVTTTYHQTGETIVDKGSGYSVIEEDNYGRITKVTNIYPEDTGNAYEITYSYNGKSITTISTQKSPAYTIRTEGTVTYK